MKKLHKNNNRKLILFSVMIIISSITMSQTLTKNNVQNEKLLHINYKEFIGKEIFNLLLDDNIRNYKELIFFDNKPGQLNGVIVKINDFSYFEIYVKEFKFLNSFNPHRTWNKELFYKESIGRIKLYVNNICKVDIGN
jgi:hypothetical protein